MTNGNTHTWKYLIEQYLANVITKEELEQLLQKTEQHEDFEALTAELKSHWEKPREKNNEGGTDWDAKFETMMEEARQATSIVPMQAKKRINRLYYRTAAAAIFILMLGAGSYFLFFKNNKHEITGANTQEVRLKNDLLPGTNGAILTLANGKKIVLDSAGNGTLAVQGKTKVINKDGQIVYDDENRATNALLYNTMTTPKGRQYQLVLVDGSKVWLNAASSIHYPAAFSGKERKVEITGEAYFEVAHNAEKPFKVIVNGMEVQVLGTHFNINSYDDEATIQTTLLEGSVKITRNNNIRMLTHGQQAQINNSPSGDEGIRVVKDVDLDVVMAWKNGYFSFEHTDLASVMRQIARWYDVDIMYEGKIPDRRFGGEISRNTNASQVLKILEESKVYFRIEGKKIIVEP